MAQHMAMAVAAAETVAAVMAMAVAVGLLCLDRGFRLWLQQ